MRKVIAGKRYDSATAELVATTEHGNQIDDNYCGKQLYRTKGMGLWFFVKCRRASGAIIEDELEVVSDGDAYAWLESHSDQTEHMAAIDRYFSDRVSEA